MFYETEIVLLLVLLLAAKEISGIGRFEHLQQLVDVYKTQHGMETLLHEAPEQLCTRKFVMNFHFPVTCKSIGNVLGAFLNNAVYALALNRTLIGKKINLSGCANLLHINNWIPRLADIKKLLADAGCPLTQQCTDFYFNPSCGYSDITDTCVINDALAHGVSIHLDGKYDPNLTTFIKHRTSILFGSPQGDTGSFEAFGIVMREVVHFDDSLQAFVEELLGTTKEGAVRISLHLRHPNLPRTTDHATYQHFDSSFKVALDYIRNQTRPAPCVVLIASDRNISIARLSDHATSIGCMSISTPKTNSSHVSASSIDEHGSAVSVACVSS